MFRPHLLVLVVPLMLLTAGSGAVAQAPQTAPKTDGPGADLPYPPPRPPTPGEIDHVPTGVRLSFDNMMDMVAGSRLVYVGEAHDNLQAHQAELRIIEDLARRFPGQIAIGMEMFRQPQQAILDRWTQGRLSELQLLEATNWLKTWGFDFGYYRAILDFARDQHIDVVALDLLRIYRPRSVGTVWMPCPRRSGPSCPRAAPRIPTSARRCRPCSGRICPPRVPSTPSFACSSSGRSRWPRTSPAT